MSLILRDGTGSGSKVKVSNENRLYTQSVSSSISANRAQDGKYYFYVSPIFTLTANGGLIGYFKNTENNPFHITGISISWNGGSTNYNRVVDFALTFGDGEPTTNTTSGTATNLNGGSTNVLSADILVWDGVGDDMTGGTAGTAAGNILCAQGFTQFPFFDSELIIIKNGTVGINVIPAEAGEFGFSLAGYVGV